MFEDRCIRATTQGRFSKKAKLINDFKRNERIHSLGKDLSKSTKQKLIKNQIYQEMIRRKAEQPKILDEPDYDKIQQKIRYAEIEKQKQYEQKVKELERLKREEVEHVYNLMILKNTKGKSVGRGFSGNVYKSVVGDYVYKLVVLHSHYMTGANFVKMFEPDGLYETLLQKNLILNTELIGLHDKRFTVLKHNEQTPCVVLKLPLAKALNNVDKSYKRLFYKNPALRKEVLKLLTDTLNVIIEKGYHGCLDFKVDNIVVVGKQGHFRCIDIMESLRQDNEGEALHTYKPVICQEGNSSIQGYTQYVWIDKPKPNLYNSLYAIACTLLQLLGRKEDIPKRGNRLYGYMFLPTPTNKKEYNLTEAESQLLTLMFDKEKISNFYKKDAQVQEWYHKFLIELNKK